MPEVLLAEALVTLEEAKLYLRRAYNEDGIAITPSAATVVEDEVITRIINYVTGEAESPAYTNRRLKSRIYDGTTWPYLYADGEGENEVDVSEWPLTTLTSIAELGSAGVVSRTLDITGHHIDSSGRIYLPGDSFAAGTLNHRITGVAGIPVTSALWKAITGKALRWIQVAWQDYLNQFGRAVSVSVGGQTISPSDAACPRDVRDFFLGIRRIL